MGETRDCPRCGKQYGPDTVLCVACGIDLRTGERLHTDAVPDDAAPDPSDETSSAGLRLLLFFGNLFPGLFRPAVLVASLALAAAAMFVFWFAMLFLSMGVVFTATAMGAGGVILYGQAIAWVLTGGFGLIHDALTDLDGNQWLVFFIVLLLPFGVFFGLVLPEMSQDEPPAPPPPEPPELVGSSGLVAVAVVVRRPDRPGQRIGRGLQKGS